MFVTMDIEIADRLLPSICSIAIIIWENGGIIDEYYSLINPDCEVEEFFYDRHGLKDNVLEKAPTLPEEWIKIYDMLDHKTVFCYDPNQVFRTLLHKAEIEQLNLPNINYGSVKSICKRTWKGLDDYSLKAMTEKLKITTNHYNAYDDAKSLGEIIYKASDSLDLNTPYDLFRAVGFAGGYIRNNKKIPYRAVKLKENGYYTTKEWVTR
jgi:DNA polymerase-3 subunit epsilon